MSTEEETFATLWAAHGLDAAPQDLSTRATITARTLAGSEQTLALGDGASPGASAGSAPGSDRGLPFISLAIRSGDGGALVEGTADADLEATLVLGEGGMGRVLLAKQRSLEREVAVKVLRPEVEDATVVQALLTEAVVAGSLEHPNIVPVHALGRDARGRPVLVMKRVDGSSWREVLSNPVHPLWDKLLGTSGDRLAASVEILVAVCHALQYAHERGVIHRDVKPDNVMLGHHGEVYLVDWGIAARPDRARVRALVGTPAYMAPEMLEGDTDRVDARTDVYLLGATLHELLVGQPRHGGTTLQSVLLQAFVSEPVKYPDGVPDELASLANESTRRERDARPASAEAFRRRLAEWLRRRSVNHLLADADQRLEVLRTEQPRALGADVAARVPFDRAAVECRFAYAQALREWPDNPRAVEGLRTCLSLCLDVELARENLDAARALALELHGEAGDPRVAELSAKLDSRRADADRALALKRDMDPSVARRERLLFLGAIVGFVGTVVTVVGLLDPLRGGRLGQITVSSMLGMTLFSTLAFVFRKRLMSSEFNRRAVAMVLSAIGVVNLHRLVAIGTGERDFARVFVGDLYILGVVAVLAATTIDRLFGIAAALLLTAGTIIAFVPSTATLFMTVGPALFVAIVVFLYRRRGATSAS